ncbi:MAG: polynucleotide adenylyltransferase PcnB, partial [Proteobacteria bacterium]|nr:polynucleotide adenylyltransferase PcnB [Pseudomonadota bacterium]
VAMAQAADSVLSDQVQRVAIPKRFSAPAREIWMLQSRFAFRRGKKAERLLAHPRFRAAYDFFCLRADTGEEDPEVAQWWTEAQEAPDALPPAPESPSEGAPKRRRRRRSRGARGSSAGQ